MGKSNPLGLQNTESLRLYKSIKKFCLIKSRLPRTVQDSKIMNIKVHFLFHQFFQSSRRPEGFFQTKNNLHNSSLITFRDNLNIDSSQTFTYTYLLTSYSLIFLSTLLFSFPTLIPRLTAPDIYSNLHAHTSTNCIRTTHLNTSIIVLLRTYIRPICIVIFFLQRPLASIAFLYPNQIQK